ncbi:hypothetical protein QTH87_05815 [Variovorax sp. J22P168]|uniref:hypothetical protein n=1 Tax=Variovorax jilinensis TaxID=3053513 RepID=UPI00257593E8|nr:hypothetical protein [Variovorax sp. J22P168]MDM0011954.1 hypothetical protein [Variovorax sp. J22P168]
MATSRPELDRYPLRQALTGPPDRLAALRHSGLLDWLGKPGRCLFVETQSGITVCAADEDVLQEVTACVRQAQGASIAFDAPRVHTMRDPLRGLLQPSMFVRLRAPHPEAERALAELLRRGARILEREWQPDALVLRAEALLADLLGYPAFVRTLAQGRATLWIWLRRYVSAQA